MELDELAGRLDRLEKSHAATRLVLAELMGMLSCRLIIEEDEMEDMVRDISGRMLTDADAEVAAMREQLSRLISLAEFNTESEWKHVLCRAVESGPGVDEIMNMLPPRLRG